MHLYTISVVGAAAGIDLCYTSFLACDCCTPPPPPTTTTTTAYYGGGIAESVNGTLSYLLSDPTLGSASASVSTTSGQVVASQLYAPYGSVRYTSGILPTDIGFTHQRADTTRGLETEPGWMATRACDSTNGRFISRAISLIPAL